MVLVILASFCMIVEHVSGSGVRRIYHLDCFFLDLAGWQLDKITENKRQADVSDSDSDSSEDLPFACLVCRKPFTDPVVTRCGHYYCSACAIKRYAKTPKCLACGATTAGIFNRADKILAKLDKQEEKEVEAHDTDDRQQAVAIEGLAEDKEETKDND